MATHLRESIQLSRMVQTLTLLLVAGSIAVAQVAQTTRPTTAAAAGSARGARAYVSNSPRDGLPFTNTSLTDVKPELPTLYIVGDSTAATGDPGHRGWGAVLVDYFDASKLNLVNFAQGGINFPTYFATRWPQIMGVLKAGDFVIIELGHNAGHLDGTGDETGPGSGRRGVGAGEEVHTFGWYIRKFVNDAKARGAMPIVSSTTVRNIWTNPNATFNEAVIVTKTDAYRAADDRVERGMGKPLPPTGELSMLVWARQVAAEENVPFIDHSNITADLYEKLGRPAVQKFHPVDRTHTSTEGAISNAETLISGLKALPSLPLLQFLNEKGNAVAPYKPHNN